ncbi:MAG TPA: hypothetical protein VJ874_05725 [Candidatus Thermoplasmatota archaeon]|nr:hypothetical protein [Candidatus Thermoplasmatota archaeon]
MRGLFVGIVGAAAIATAAFGLSLDGMRAGPFEVPLLPAVVAAEASGTYHARGESTLPGGVCPLPPCGPSTAIDLRLRGLPGAPYEVRLEGPGASEPLGPLAKEGADLVLRWSEPSDHTDKQELVVTLAGRDVARLPVRASATPIDLAGRVEASWEARPDRARVSEIGGVTLSTIATARLEEPPPAGWEFRARFESATGTVELGALEDATMDARVERLRLEDQDRLVIVLVPMDAADGAGFPVLVATIWAR